MYRPTALIVLDGFGIAPMSDSNAVHLAKKDFFNKLIFNFPTLLLEASGINVGLPEGEVGNSEVGHLTIGSGILRYQSLPRIDKSISSGDFFELPDLVQAIKKIKNTKNKIHILGLVSNGGVHSSQEHLNALLKLMSNHKVGKQVFIHAFLDGRDTAKDLGQEFIAKLQQTCQSLKVGQIASLSGRFYAMDRNKNWDRIEKAYQAIVNGQSEKQYSDPVLAIKDSYQSKIYDEEFVPTVIVDKKNQPLATVENGDVIIFFNFRADRARQLTKALALKDFDKFQTKKIADLEIITFTEYEKGLPVKILFPPEIVENPLAKIISEANLKQLHIAETEKYAHVTFFMNGMREEVFLNEDRVLIPSPAVTSYDEKPEMSALEVTAKILQAIKQDRYDFYVINYANPDMVGHTGNLEATVKAVETVDQCLAKIVPEFTKRGGSVFIVGDHGNAEELINPITGEIDKEHNNYPVPFIIVNNNLVGQVNQEILNSNDLSLLSPVGILADVSPTILKTIDLPLAPEMTGMSLI